MKTGIELIAEERQRQISIEGWTSEHDDQHYHRELNKAAQCYCEAGVEAAAFGFVSSFTGRDRWPWEREWWKPSEDPVRNLVKAGALIAAEIDRLHRLKTPKL